MPTIEALDYERFSYEDPNARPLALDEAVKQAAERRRADPSSFYRVESTDATATGFRVERISMASAYAGFVARLAQRFVRGATYRKS